MSRIAKRNEWFSNIIADLEAQESEHQWLAELADRRERRMDEYWKERHRMIPRDWRCPSCGLVREKSRQWVIPKFGEAICKSCHLVKNVHAPIPDVTIKPIGTHYKWRPDLDIPVREQAKILGVSFPTCQRWRAEGVINVEAAEYVPRSHLGPLIVKKVRITPLGDLVHALGLTRRTFEEVIGMRRNKGLADEVLPLKAYVRLRTYLEAMSEVMLSG